MKKKWIILLLTLILIVSTCACGARKNDQTDGSTSEGHAASEDSAKDDKASEDSKTTAGTSDQTADTMKEETTTGQKEDSTTEKTQDSTIDSKAEDKTTASTEKKEETATSKKEETTTEEKNETSSDTAIVTYPISGSAKLSNIEYTVVDPNNTRGLSTTKISFSFGAAKNGSPHSITVDNQKQFDSYDSNALAWDNKTGGKILYLTFDCGYEYENLTSEMLDTLKEKNVKAAFFCTMSYLKTAPNVVTRMINEGHIVGNHTTNHPSNSAALTRTELAEELLGVHNYLRVKFGYNSEYFRFPAGVYSENALDLVDSVGYKSVFWSIAHTDWDPENQPGVDKSFQTVTERLHPGAVILLHTTSPDNAEILGDFIDYAREQGYEFRTLDQYKYWN